jgi:hypothetical protein
MQHSNRRAHIIAILLLAGGSLAIALTGAVRSPEDILPVAASLPARLEPFEGQIVWFCQNMDCRSRSPQYVESELAGATNCPSCGAMLDVMSPVEKILLPTDTILMRRQYREPGEEAVLVTVVVSGKDRMSIHRPQNCLPAAGWRIGQVRTLAVPVIGYSVLKLRTMEAKPSVPGRDGTSGAICYAYWYTDGQRQTCSQVLMMLSMGWDRVVSNKARRWAFISLATPMSAGSQDHIERLSALVSRLYPLITRASGNPIVGAPGAKPKGATTTTSGEM